MSFLKGRKKASMVKCVICRKIASGTYKDKLPICYICKGMVHGPHIIDYKKGEWNFRQT